MKLRTGNLLMGLIASALSLISAPLFALSLAEVTALHDRLQEPYRLRTFAIDDGFRSAIAGQLSVLPQSERQEIERAVNGALNGAEVHVYQQADTSLVSYIAAVAVEGEVVLLTWHSTAFFEASELVNRRIALLDELLRAFSPARYPRGSAAGLFNAATEAAQSYGAGERSGPYPGWSYDADARGASLATAVIPDWVEITVTTLPCAPRYPRSGWLIQFACPES